MRILHTISLAAIGAAVTLAATPAQAAEDKTEASATGKGITGGVLLGGEVVMLGEAAFKVKPAWAYAVGGLAGGVAGGVGGYFIEKGGDAKLTMYMLAGGMALIIPTTVAVLSASAYEPPASFTEDKGPTEEPVAEPPRPESAPATQPTSQRTKKQRARRVAHHDPRLYAPVAPPALLGVGPTSVTLSLPAVEVRDAYSRAELMQFGVKQATEVRVPVFNFVF